MNNSRISLNVSDLTPNETAEMLRQLADLIEACEIWKPKDGVVDDVVGFAISREDYKPILKKSNSFLERHWINDDGDEDFFIDNIVISESSEGDVACVELNSRVAEWIYSGETFEKFFSDRVDEDKA